MTESFVDPQRAQFEAFKALDRDHTIDMLNLVRFRAEAAYPRDHEHADSRLSGAEAYKLYGEKSGPIFARVGGEIIWRGQMQSMLIGPDDVTWDLTFIATYPTAHAFLDMVSDPDYQRAVVHRQAAVETSRLVRFRPGDTGATFG